MSVSRTDIQRWMEANGWSAFPFQIRTWNAMRAGASGMLNAPTGSGKTFAAFLGALQRTRKAGTEPGLRVLWITPLRALAKDVTAAMAKACTELGTGWEVGMRTGDTSATVKKKQQKMLPHVLVTTPESVHVMLASAGSDMLFRNLETIVVDEWHELMGSKRGVQTELAVAHLRRRKGVALWGISATIGNMRDAIETLHGTTHGIVTIKAPSRKRLHIETLLPESVENFPWTGHLGTTLLEQAEAVCRASASTLVFTNTRSQAEIWYRQFLERFPEYAGSIALHHGSLDADVRAWVEDALKAGRLKVVFCTSSLDLGVDFHTVEQVIQIGSPKGVGRFLQRAGRSGHSPEAQSRIAFLPTHSLEIVEGAAIKDAVRAGTLENRTPYSKPIDVLAQWLVTLACGDGFRADEALATVRSTAAYRTLTDDEWSWTLNFVTRGGPTLKAYPEYHKVTSDAGTYRIVSVALARRHRMSIGTIASDASIRVQYLRGGMIGTIEENFITKLEPGDRFWYGGHSLELVHIKEMTAFVRKSSGKDGAVPRWMGGRLPLSSQLAEVLRQKLHEAADGVATSPEMKKLVPLFELQKRLSCVPHRNEFLIETFHSREGYHCFFYPFEGRLAHEGMAAVVALRLSMVQSISFTMAMNDYGFELLSDVPIPLEEGIRQGLFDVRNLTTDILHSVNATLMAKRKFREIARIAGLVFQGFPSKTKLARQLQASAELFFEVFSSYDKENLLLRQAFDETLAFQLEEERLRAALHRIATQRIVVMAVERPTPFALPILVDRLREKLGSERAEERIRKMSLVRDRKS